MYEVHLNISEKPYTYEWVTVGKYSNYFVACEKVEKIRASGRWAVVHDNTMHEIQLELNRDAREYSRRYTKTETVTNWCRESWGCPETYSVSIERITEAYTEYSESKMYW